MERARRECAQKEVQLAAMLMLPDELKVKMRAAQVEVLNAVEVQYAECVKSFTSFNKEEAKGQAQGGAQGAQAKG